MTIDTSRSIREWFAGAGLIFCLVQLIWLVMGTSCSWGPTPISVGGWGFTAKVVIPKSPPKIVPVTASAAVTQPVLMVPLDTENAPTSAAVTAPSGDTVSIPVAKAPVAAPVLTVPAT